MALIDMQTMRYLNLLSKTARVQSNRCFMYNNTVIFVVPKDLVRKAVGPQGEHVRILQQTTGKRVKIIAEASEQEANSFVQSIVDPVSFKSFELVNGEFVLTAGSHSKAALLGRNRVRLEELSRILEDTFGKKLRII